MSTEPYSRDHVTMAANAAADMIIEECDLTADRVDLINITINAVLTALDNDGDVSLSDVADSCYDEDVTGDTLRAWAEGEG